VHLCRYITRRSRSGERERLNGAGAVRLNFQKPWRDGSAYPVMKNERA
jgi:hypothetical protein